MLIIKPMICDNCKYEVKELPFELNWNYETKRCLHCHKDEESTRRYEFCSSRCLRVWAKKFDNHKHQWDLNPMGGGATVKKGKVLSVLVHCKICKAQDWHNKDKKLINKYKKLHKPYLAMSAKLNENDNTRHSKKSVHKPKK